MSRSILKSFALVLWVYLSAFLIFSMNSKAQETQEAKGKEAKATESKVTKSKTTESKAAEMKPIRKGKNVRALIKTSMGDIEVELFASQVPETVKNFIGLADGTKEYTDPKTGKKAKGHFYDGVIFHRVIKGFMIQTGDPTGTGMGGFGEKINAEIKENLKHDSAGVLAMARAQDINSASSQFYITLAPAPHLNGSYTVFGRVIPESLEADKKVKSIEVVKKIGDVPVKNERPVKDVTVISIRTLK